MYNIEVFEQLIKSNLSSEDVYEKIMEMNPIYTKEKYSIFVSKQYPGRSSVHSWGAVYRG